ncbi:MAG: carboxymuconolactone decarboxylase family protein [Gammaproteobacteria bacterium]|nr:carboxymuconolactone decarboxylase family protein [Gammaproteobacteria bacterium]MBQ0838916.1 carboxymuconolactone decarboxylase family protein [Gammaproteobacteria bacterium]
MFDKIKFNFFIFFLLIVSSVLGVNHATAAQADYEERRARGVAVLQSLTGRDDATELAARLEAENGALGSFALDFVLGDIWSRPGLSKRDRNLIVLTMLATLHQTKQLSYYVPGGLNHGLTATEIREIMTHIAAYAGFPRALDAMAETNRILAKLGHGPENGKLAGAEKFSNAQRRERGAEVMAKLSGNPATDPDKVIAAMACKLGPLGAYGIDFAFGEVWARSQLSRRDRSLLVVSVLTVLGRTEELHIHVPAAIRHGVTKAELEELMLTAFAYAGAPLAVEGMHVVQALD